MLVLVAAAAQRAPLVERVGQMTFVLGQRLRVLMHLYRDVEHVSYQEAMKTKRRHIDAWRANNRERLNQYKRSTRPSRAK